MARLKKHCEECVEKLGESFKEVNEWLDGLAFVDKNIFDTNHRRHRHHKEGIEEAVSIFGEKIRKAAILHIEKDMGRVYSKEELKKFYPWWSHTKQIKEKSLVEQYSKMYLLVKDWIDVGHAVNSCAHAGAMIDGNWSKDDPIMKDWHDTSFRKCTCKVTEKEFEKAKEYDDWFVVTEMAFDTDEVVLVFKPRKEWPRFFSFLKLYK